MRADQSRIKEILKETILALLNNGVEFASELEVDGLLGVTVDRKDVFLVKINEIVPSLKKGAVPDKDSSDDEASSSKASTTTPNKGRRKRRSPSPKLPNAAKSEKRQRVASPTQSVPSSSTQQRVEGQEFGQIDIDLTSVKMEPVDTTVADSNHSAEMSDVGPNFDFNQQQPHITSIQAVSQQPEREAGCSTWQAPPDVSQLNQQTLLLAGGFLTPPSAPLSSGLPHAEAKLPKNRRKRCRLCYRKGVRRDVASVCAGCMDKPALCPHHFAEYHSLLGIPVLAECKSEPACKSEDCRVGPSRPACLMAPNSLPRTDSCCAPRPPTSPINLSMHTPEKG